MESLLSLPPWQFVADQASLAGFGPEHRAAQVFRAEHRFLGSVEDGQMPEVVFWRDLYGWCPFCMPVQFALEEKQIPYCVRKVGLDSYRIGDKPADFVRVVPDGVVPALTVRGDLCGKEEHTVSRIDACLRALEKEFSGSIALDHRTEGADSSLLRGWRQLSEELESTLHIWLASAANNNNNNSSATGDPMQCLDSLMTTLEALELTIEQEAHAHGGPYLCGKHLSHADLYLLPWAERCEAFVGYFNDGPRLDKAQFPRFLAWLASMRARPAYHGLRLDEETLRSSAQCFAASRGRNLRAAKEPTVLPAAAAPSFGGAAAEAAGALAHCRHGILELMAAIAPAGAASAAVPFDSLLRLVAWQLIPESSACAQALGQQSAMGIVTHARKNAACDVDEKQLLQIAASGLVFLRQRISVPRDMSDAAASELRMALLRIASALVGEEAVSTLLCTHEQAYSVRFLFGSKASREEQPSMLAPSARADSISMCV